MKIFLHLLILLLPLFISHVLSRLIGGNSVEDMDNVCPVCYDSMLDIVFMTRCRHNFHCQCISKWIGIDPTCPMCKRTITGDPVIEEIMAAKLKTMELRHR